MRWAVCFLIACNAGRTPAVPAQPDPTIASIAEQAIRNGEAVGIAVAIAHGDRIYARGFGQTGPQDAEPITERTVFPLASLSKQFWAVELLRASRLPAETIADKPVAAMLTGFPDPRVRVRDLLQQTSGLGDDHDGEDDVAFSDLGSAAFAPGTWWRYSNRGAILARQIADVLEPDALAKEIAIPLGLASIGTCGPHVPLWEHGVPSGLPEATMRRVRFVCGDALDVMRFEIELDRLLPAETLAAMRTPVEVPGVGPISYGWLTRIADLDGHRAYGHTGNFDGVSVAAFRFPADDLTIVVLINSTPKPGFTAPALLELIARHELGLAARHAMPLPGGAPDLVGTYDVDGERGTVTLRDGAPWLAVAGHEVPLGWLGGRRFIAGPFEVEFLPATGRAKAVAVGSRFMVDTLARRVEP